MVAIMNAPWEDGVAQERRALRFLMAGSVDDGKSTLTGRLLFESQAILADQLGRLRNKAAAGEAIDLALLTDGLEAEREQGITIDVAYRYFSTRRRKFIIADAPGHEQYTRNMVTAAAGSDAAVVLVDIAKLDLSARPVKLLPQTRRHTLLANLLRVPTIVFAINKIDAVPDPATAFEAVSEALLEFTRAAGISVAGIVPISALNGDNVTTTGTTPWYRGASLLEILEYLEVEEDSAEGPLLIPVQYVSLDPATPGNSTRVIWGRIARGNVKAGDQIQIFPSNERASVVEVRLAGETVDSVSCGQSAGVVLDRHVDVARGSWLSAPHTSQSSQRFAASLAWMDTEPAQLGRKYLIRHGSRWVQGRIVSIQSCVDIHTLEPTNAHALAVNDIGEVTIETQQALPVEPYLQNRAAGSMIVVDPSTHHTSGTLLVKEVLWENAPAEARSSARVEADFPIMYQNADAEFEAAKALNVSLGGLLMASDDVLPVGGEITIRFKVPARLTTVSSRDVRLHARVVDHRSAEKAGYQYHLAFFDVNPAMHQLLSAVIQSLQSH